MQRTEWFKRKFPIIEDNGIFLSIVERLAGTPARLEEMTADLSDDIMPLKPDGKWSIKEEIGHLSDLEALWSSRVDDFVNKLPELTAADLTNRKTHEADHNATPLKELLANFRKVRKDFVGKMMRLDDAQLDHAALHPRLKTSMRVIDLAYFVAEHDDHHLATIRGVINHSSRPT